MSSLSSAISVGTEASRPEARVRSEDEYLFGWKPTPGIVSVWAFRDGRALIWRRPTGMTSGPHEQRVTCASEAFYPWVLATTLDDVRHLGASLQPFNDSSARDDLVPSHRDDLRPSGDPLGRPSAPKVLVRYRKLSGPERSYCYLLMARTMHTLERAVLTGASRRLGQPVSSLKGLDTYYVVGPVEQYLMQTGQVYFRDLKYSDLHRMQFDLETTALDPHRGRIFMVAVRDNRGLATTLEAARPEDEAGLIRDLCALVRERDPDVIENHNLFGFDLPFLEHRALVQNIALELGRKGGPLLLESYQETLAIGPEARKRTRYSLPGRELIDTLDAVRRHDFVVRDMPGYGLKEVARYFGIASPDRTYIAGAEIFETFRHDPARVRSYALDDVAEVDGLSQRLLGAPFALASMAPRRYERLASAGPAMGVLEPILVRSYLRAGAAPPYQASQQSMEDGLHEGGAVHLLATGVAEYVVKADVASLYPSLMRTFQIGPACDHLGVLLNILSRLTDLRLQHKESARIASPGSLEWNHHTATQAAMKILINAAYGYMGAGSMALFADGRAAGEVTRRGREILTQVLDALKSRGLALIEADTDGVYFAVPSDWTEEQEQVLVQEIGAQLPAGIRLEYEGRYRAMFSHEVKNYALLAYDGRLVVRGVALRSSRAEPFGVNFLRQALLCTMTGDIPGLRNTYLETVAALRSRELPAADLATRVRLSKTPETYMAARAGHPEPAYEALLNAGRTRWFPGERVRFYRTRGKNYVWVPEETEEASVDSEWTTQQGPPQPSEGHEGPAGGSVNADRSKTSSATARPLNTHAIRDQRDYDVDHYLQVLVTSYAARLRKAFAPEDFEQLFRLDQPGLFDLPIEGIQPIWIRCR
ncbi:MAG TPA: DNA polymerase domain-containing protein [Ktedonosporobacter sp.]|nr:DNA polymerase domain-containing protein [Ktedonosporobacter sp.]